MTLQAKMITGFLVLGAIALLTGSVLVLGYAIAILAIGAIVFVAVPPLVREISMLSTGWLASMRRGGIRRSARTSSPAQEHAA